MTALASVSVSCADEAGIPGKAVFTYFEYTGNDARFDKQIDPNNEYFNPIVAGYYPDPSFCRKGDDYFMVTSSFAHYPGIPIFHSKDLVNWTQIGHVLNRPSQLKVDGMGISDGVFAPAIRYNPHNDTFYVINTIVGGIGNFLVKTKDPFEGNWSEPIHLPAVGGIDPSLLFDDDGKAYIVHNDEPPGPAQWSGHRAIWGHRYDTEKDVTFGEKILLVDGGVDPSTHPVWIEAPHLYKIDGYYYLMCAEGGTSTDHSEVIFRSENPLGPFKPGPVNPILTQRDLPENRPDKVTSSGHADLIQTPEGEWWSVFLATRPYEGDLYNTGRETWLLPVKWVDGYPIILDKGAPIPTVGKKSGLTPKADTYLTGNFTWRDEFDGNEVAHPWVVARTLRDQWFTQENGRMVIDPLDRSIYERVNPAFLARRQQHMAFVAETEMTFTPENENQLAGIACFQNESFNIVMGKTVKEGKYRIVLDRMERQPGPSAQRQAGNGKERVAEIEIPSGKENKAVRLKVQGNGGRYSFYVSYDKGESWETVAEGVDATNLSTNKAGGFVGTIIGMYATSKFE